MRSLAAIDAEISATSMRLAELHDERRAAVAARLDAVVAAFDAGKRAPEIARDFGLSLPAVRRMLSERGRTLRGRAALASYMAAIGHRSGSAAT